MASFTFAANATVSSALDFTQFDDIGRERLNSLVFPSTWISGTVSFKSSSDSGNTYQAVYLPGGTPYSVTAAPNEEVVLDLGVLGDLTNIQLVSSVSQTTGCTVNAILVDMSEATSIGGEVASATSFTNDSVPGTSVGLEGIGLYNSGTGLVDRARSIPGAQGTLSAGLYNSTKYPHDWTEGSGTLGAGGEIDISAPSTGATRRWLLIQNQSAATITVKYEARLANGTTQSFVSLLLAPGASAGTQGGSDERGFSAFCPQGIVKIVGGANAQIAILELVE